MIFFPLLFAAMAVDDRDIAARLKQRDPDAMADLYDRYGRMCYALIYRIVRDGGVAEDLTQETFLRVWNRVGAFDGDKGSLGAWIMIVARNRAIDYLRSVDGRMRENAYDLAHAETPALFNAIEANLIASDRARYLKKAFDSLNANQKLVIELAYYEGLTQNEMSERLQQPLGTVKTWVRSALLRLREELGEAVSV
jgi:RNA polymerase sigma-70 factor (ECF subfamily)